MAEKRFAEPSNTEMQEIMGTAIPGTPNRELLIWQPRRRRRFKTDCILPTNLAVISAVKSLLITAKTITILNLGHSIKFAT